MSTNFRELPEPQIEAACKALWDSRSHKMLKMGGYPIDYESQGRLIKMDLRREVNVVWQAIQEASK